MIIDKISLTGLRVFESVLRNSNMSIAAKELFMTQPGVSQHIKQIENLLEINLFDRVGKLLVPTATAKLLYAEVSPILFDLENKLSEIGNAQNTMRGKISFGMPIEFGNNVILPILSNWSKQYAGIYFHINYDHAQRQLKGLLDGSLDFAITDSFAFPDQIQTTNLAREQLVLCCSLDFAKHNNLNARSSFKTLENFDYITYLEDSTVVKQWFTHHFKKDFSPNKRATLMDVQGVSKLILSGLGIGILSMHMVRQYKLEEKLVIFEGSNKPLFNEINLSQVKAKTMSISSQTFIDFLVKSLSTNKKGP